VANAMESIAGAGRGNSPQNLPRRALRSFIHFFSYHLILKRNKTRWTHASGFRLVVRPTVFHPRYFVTSKFFAKFIGRLDLTGKRVADVGTGTGILALAAARAGAANVVAIDINPNAVEAAAENARANGLEDRVTAIRSDLLSEVAPGPQPSMSSCRTRRSFPTSRATSPIGRGTPGRTTAILPRSSTRRASGSRPTGRSISCCRRTATSTRSGR
jgi:hypothetical protein